MSSRQISQCNEIGFEGICNECGEGCRAVVIDNSFDHAFGTEHLYDNGSPCCHAEVVEGGMRIVDQQNYVAKKSHGEGIEKGDTYCRTVRHHWRENGPGWFTVLKGLVSKGQK